MIETLPVHDQNIDYYNDYVMRSCVFEAPKPVIASSYRYEKSGVLYCATATESEICFFKIENVVDILHADEAGDFDFRRFNTHNYLRKSVISASSACHYIHIANRGFTGRTTLS
jgi:hypothetical protein